MSHICGLLVRNRMPSVHVENLTVSRKRRSVDHNLRHSLSNWLVNKARENPKTVQGILGHSRIQTTLDLYSDTDLESMIEAQDRYVDAVGI